MSTRPQKRESSLSWQRVLLLLIFAGVVAGGGVAGGFVMGAVRDLPAITSIEPKPSMTSFVYAQDGGLFARLHAEENRTPVRFSKMPLHLRQAAVAIEDHQFYEHKGINIRAMIRALYINLTGRKIQGASTITQQLAKNVFLTNEVTYKRKIQEIALAFQLERRYMKDEILEMYLNQIPFGNGAYGVEAAAQIYFGKSSEQLTLPESAFLVGITNAPSMYDPYRHLAAARERQKVVLQEMVKVNFITEDEYKKAAAAPLTILEPQKPEQEQAAHFTDFVISYLLPKYGKDQVYNGGLKVYTTLDLRIQKVAEDAIKRVLDQPFPIKPNSTYPEAAAVVMDVKTGYIRAMVGGRTHTKRLELNRAVQAKRQPGSAFKPLVVYGAALEAGITPGTVIDDVPVEFPQAKGEPLWAPENYDKVFHGLVTVREALENSYNVVAVRVLEKVGVPKGVEFAQKLGIQGLITSTKQAKNDLNLSVALGGLTEGVTPLEMTVAFGTYAARGMRVEPLAILKVLDKDGNVLEDNKPKRQLVISENTACMMTNLLEGVIQRGTGMRAGIGRPAAGKTGTTSDYRDAWFIGFTPDLVGTVWMGFDRVQTMEKWKVTGGLYPAQIWSRIMSEAHKSIPVSRFVPAKNLVTTTICTKSGKLPGAWCPAENVRQEIFFPNTQPVEVCDVHVPVEVCADDPTRFATPFCRRRETKSFIRRQTPYVAVDDKHKPIDALLEVPTESCKIHMPFGR